VKKLSSTEDVTGFLAPVRLGVIFLGYFIGGTTIKKTDERRENNRDKTRLSRF